MVFILTLNGKVFMKPSTFVSTKKDASKEAWLFIKRWLKHPLRLGAILPSSNSLAELIAEQVDLKEDHVIVELGAGTGSLTRRLIAKGVSLDRLYIIELDPELHSFLQRSLPEAHVILGNACDLPRLLPAHVIGKVSTIVSGMPVSAMPFSLQNRIVDAALTVMAPDGEIVQYSYRHSSPMPAHKLGLSHQKIGITFKNIPPATVWRYQRLSHQHAA